MKYKAFIAKGLAFGIILNSISVLSYASTEISNRYQILEGEYITIDDSTKGNLEEIEIFGNTIQDENNLEDIQSVGDLYVDEDGNPILDSQGREQYKIEIESSNSNILDLKDFSEYPKFNRKKYKLPKSIKVNKGEILTLYVKGNVVFPGGQNDYHTVAFLDNTDSGINTTINVGYGEKCFNGNLNKYLLHATKTTTVEYISFINSGYPMDIVIEEFGLYRGETNSYISREYEINNILLPTQLQRVGDVADRLYWDSDKNRYIVDKYIKEWTIDFCKKSVEPHYGKEINFHRLNVLSYYRGDDIANFRDDKWKINSYRPISDKIVLDDNAYLHGNLYGKDFAIGMTWDGYFRLDISKEYKPTEKDANDFISNLGMIKFLMIKRKAESIETNVTSKIKIPTYDEKTHIYVNSENNINPTLKVTVDRLPQIAKEAVAQAERDNTNHNISLARRYINMLPESSYKDQLQNQLSDIFSSDMVLDMKTATSNLDVYIKSENILQMSLDTNSISFEDFSGIEDVVKENAVNITINSSLPYQLNAYLPSEIQNADKTKTLDKSILNIKENSETAYQTFINTTDKIVLKDNCSAGNQLTHGVDLKLAGGIAHEKDVYKAIIKLEVEQK